MANQGATHNRAGAGRPGALVSRRSTLRRGGGVSVRIGRGTSRVRLAEIQRSRLLAAAVDVIDELGYSDVSVGSITKRSRVSRRTFYELFASREACMLALLGDATAALEQELREAGLESLPWREQVRMGLWPILCYLDREPALARVLVVESLQAGPAALEVRDRVLTRLAAAVDAGREESRAADDCNAMTAEGIVGAAFAILYSRLQRRDHEPLASLLGELTGMVVLPYLGAAAARRERTRPTPALPPNLRAASQDRTRSGVDPLRSVPMRVTYRTTLVLDGVAEKPGASNRQIGEHAGIHDQGQVSKLLARLERLGILENTGCGRAKGEPNAWQLTSLGQRVAHSIQARTHGQDGQRSDA